MGVFIFSPHVCVGLIKEKEMMLYHLPFWEDRVGSVRRYYVEIVDERCTVIAAYRITGVPKKKFTEVWERLPKCGTDEAAKKGLRRILLEMFPKSRLIPLPEVPRGATPVISFYE